MLDSAGFTIAAVAPGRVDLVVEDMRPAGAADDLVRRRDQILIERAQAGSLDAFNDIVTCYQDHLFSLVARMVPDPDQANDAVQEAFFSAYRNLAGFRGGSVRSWLSRIAINAAMDQQRLRKRRPSQPYPELEDDTWQPPAGPEADPERTALEGERSKVLQAALAAITPDQRHAIVMFDVEGFDYQEIADLTGVSLGTVKSRIHRGRLALRDRLAGSMSLFREVEA
jgi:RNA polymerase sigma-70 factor (ECF subfamily)